MDETPDQIKREIEQARERIGVSLQELEHQVQAAVDWKANFDRRPWAFLGAAFGIAFLIGWISTPRPLRERF